MKWVWNRILHVDLASGKIRVLKPGYKAYRLLHGGRGIAALLLYKLTGDTPPSPLDAENPLIIAPGLLTGSGLSTASKTIIAGRSPLTGLLGRSSVGARLGPELRASGFDALVVTGTLEQPGMLIIDKDGVRLGEAEDLWGLRISDARSRILKRYKGYSTCIIGPAGENLVRYALMDCDGRQAGRTGMGAVMGSKRLKAIIVKAWMRPEPSDIEGYKRLLHEWARHVPSTSASKTLMKYGTPAVLGLTEPQGVLPSLNWRRSTLSWCPDRDKAREEYIEYPGRNRYTQKPCIHCNRPCSQVIRVRDPLSGEEKELDGPEYELLYSLGTNLGFCHPENAAKLSLLADELGLDGISLGGVLGWLLEAVERGDIGEELIRDYPGLEWGSLNALAKVVHDIAYVRGKLAQILVHGALGAAKLLGRGEEYAVQVKGMCLPAYDGRGLKGMALGYAVSSRGGDHLTSGMYAIELGGKLWIYENVDPLSYEGKPSMVRAMEDLFAAYDNLGVCKFSRRELPPERLAEAVEVLTGIPSSAGDVLLGGERTVTLERIINLSYGLEPGMDWLPERLTKDPISDGPRKGETVEPERLREMVREYYQLRGWDAKGKPYRETLVVLGLQELLSGDLVAEAL